MSRRRKVYRLKAGNINRLRISEEELDTPNMGEVQIEVKSIGLNFADVFAILGLYSATPKEAFIPGLEFSGRVIEIGDEVKNLSKGDLVAGITRFGAYTSQINIDERYLIHLPESWNFEEGAAYLVQVLTAYYGLVNLGAIKNGYKVLIHSAAGGVGIWANRIAKYYGACTIGTVGNSTKLKLLEQEQYNHSIVRDEQTFARDLEAVLKDDGLDLIMECIGGKIMKIGFENLAPMGRLIVYGSAQYGDRTDRPNYFKLIPKYLSRPRIDPQNMIAVNRSVMAFNLIYLFEKVGVMNEILRDLQTMNLGKPFIGHRFTFSELPEAIRFFQSGKSVGKIVVNL